MSINEMGFREIREHLSQFTVGIAGAGGLGSNCAVALARSGVGTLVICDFDRVDASNLNRQYYFLDQAGSEKTFAIRENIWRIDPSVRVETVNVKLTPANACSIFSKCDIVVEALDAAGMKEMLISALQTGLPGLPVITGSGLAGWGHTSDLRVRKIDDTLFVCGDETSEESPDNPVMAPRVLIVAAMQANTVIELLMKKKK